MWMNHYATIRDNLNGRNLRERSLIFVCLLALVFMLWSLVVQPAMDKKGRELRSQGAAINTQRDNLNTQIAEATRQLAADPNRELKNRITQLESALAQADQQMVNVSQGLVLANELPQLLQQTLLQTTRLRLKSVETLPVRELSLRASAHETQGAGVYQHTVVLRVTGHYFQVLDFVRALETTSARFYWDRLDYAVKRYPNADIEIRVYTLSTDRGPIGG